VYRSGRQVVCNENVPSESVNANIDRLERLETALAIDNIGKLGLERGSAHEESINIGLRRQIGRRLGRGRPTVQDSRVGGHVGTDHFTQILANGLVRVLRLLRRGGQTSTNRPNRFVGNDNILPIVGRKDIGVGLDLGKHKVVGRARLTAFQRFATARHDLQSFVDGELGLGGDFTVAFALTPALRVTNNGPRDAHILRYLKRVKM
jgi:hypothetical protein